jgi:transcription initiation factor TFIIIB Brf1 subunit/transcription initiation factor TFIIB
LDRSKASGQSGDQNSKIARVVNKLDMRLCGYPAILLAVMVVRSILFLLACDRRIGEMSRANARGEAERRLHDCFASTVVIAAAIIAAVRLAREPDICKAIASAARCDR